MPTHAVVVGREDLLDVALGDDVAHRGAPVAGHDHAAGVRHRDDRRAVRGLHVPAGSVSRDGRRSGAAAPRNSVNELLPVAVK
jgi:hypothetical protein